MGEDCRSWPPRPHFGWQPHSWNSFTAPLVTGQEIPVTAHINPINRNYPVCAVPELPNLQQMGQANDPPGWFYCSPQFRQAFAPVTVSTVKEKVPGGIYGNILEGVPPHVGSNCLEKKFLVFDQSGDQTTLMFGSDLRKPVQLPTWIKRFPSNPGAYNLNVDVPGPESGINHLSEPILTSKLNENRDSDEVSEMHEDTEELNALLYSDDESDYTGDDEVTSTGHSPGSVTDHDKPDSLEGSSQEAASCNKPTRKRKLWDENHEDTASSGNPKISAEHEYDTEFSCNGGNNSLSDETDSSSKNKRLRIEKIKETIDILQKIIPIGKGKDAGSVLDEAIQYLKSLKLKAEALGLGTL